jgi:predicted DNA-binding protein (MmcQ/YjbR family)
MIRISLEQSNMDLETLRGWLLAKPGAVATYPFGAQPLVVKAGGKIFALVSEDTTPLTISLKCEPAHAQFLRDSFTAVRPGYHLNKEHWNTVTLDGSIPDAGIQEMIDESYQLVIQGLSRAARGRLVQGNRAG